MDNREEGGPCSSCCTVVLIAGISVALVRWDIDTYQQWKTAEELTSHDYYGLIWSLGMCLTISLVWFSLPLLVVTLACRLIKIAQCIGIFLLVCGGPNLLLWNILGCIIGSFEFKDFCISKNDCDTDFMVIVMRSITWGFLYIISFICSYGLWRIILDSIKGLRLKSKVKNWRTASRAGEKLLDHTCSICLDHFGVNEKIRELTCKHTFHMECVDIWMQEHETCPICRQAY
ncbi:unnamed protein product [Blepharisma stoltei]|uniref:RING-type domain-containing protein n=1 Tax=Blepharisma stoltei TaxID=1481888 RepID=A0AAU9J029_9CILI|nr:unnamed protein product [Blepharisma stoltei]